MQVARSEVRASVPNPHGVRVPDLEERRGELVYIEQRITATRSLRDDPLGQMHSRKQIGPAQYRAGREYQATREDQGIGRGRSSSELREHVDGGQIASDGVTEAKQKAARKVDRWKTLLGSDWWVVEAVLIDKRTIRQIADASDLMSGKAATTFYGHLFRRQLTMLARDMGFA